MPTRTVVEGIEKYRSNVHAGHQDLFERLKDGQQPEVLLITCSDSRIDPALFTQTRPGDLFVLRNAGNLVGPHDATGSAEAGTIEYAVKALKVRHIVVCGHRGCGAMAAVLDPASVRELPAVDAWLKRSGAKKAPGQPTLEEQVRFNAITQLDNLRAHPAVADAEGRGELSLHAWVYDFVSGEVADVSTGSAMAVGTARAGRSTT